MKKLCLLFCLMIFLTGCSLQDSQGQPDTSEELRDEYNIIGEYKCDSQYFKEFTDNEEFIPTVNFYNDGICMMKVYFIGGYADINGKYTVDGDQVSVVLDFSRSRFEDTGTEYLDDKYVFTITDNEHLTIDRKVYAVDAGDTFIKVSDKPEETMVYDPDIVGKYICRSEYYNDEYIIQKADTVPYIVFYEGYECKMYVDYNDEYSTIYGKYSFDGKRISVSLFFVPAMYGENPLVDKIAHEYIFTLTDENSLEIDKGFLHVNSGDTFVKELPENAGSTESETVSKQEKGFSENYNVYEITGDDPIFSKTMNQNPIDESYSLEMHENATATKDFTDIENKYLDIWKTEMEYSIGQFTSMLSEKDRSDFDEVQSNWEKSAIESLTLENSLLVNEDYGVSLGSGYKFLIISQKRELYRQRTIRIKYLHYLLETSENKSISVDKCASLQFLFAP